VIASGQVLFVFTLAVIAAARIGGRGPGLLASSLSVLLTWYTFTEPRFSFRIAGPVEVGNLVALAVAGAAISFLSGRAPVSPHSRGERPGDNSFFRRIVLFGSAFLMLAVVTRILYTDFAREKDLQGWVTHSYQILNATQAVLSNLQDAETGKRGYQLTGDERYLEPFQSAIREEQSARRTLRQLTADNPAQQARLDVLDQLVEAKFAELQKTITLRRQGQVDAALAVLRTGEGKRIMDACRAALHAMEEEDRLLLAKQTRAAEVQGTRMRWVLGFGSGSLLLLLAIAGAVIERDSRNRELAREAASLGEQRLHLALDAANAGTWEWDPRTGDTIWSEELWRVFGLRPHSLQPSYEAWQQLVNPDDLARVEQATAEAARGGTELNVEFRLCDLDGKERWLLSRGRRLQAGDGRAARLVGIVLDITGRKKAEEAARLSEGQFQTLANAIPQLCWMANADGWVFWYNQRWFEYTGTTPQQMEGWGWQSVHDPTALADVLERWKSSIATGDPFDMIFPLRDANGVFRPFLTRIMPVRDPEGKVSRWFGTNTDISEQRKIEDALRLSEERLRTFVKYVPAGVAMLDREMRYLQVSDRWCADYSVSSLDLLGRSHYEVFPDLPERWKQIHCRCLAGETLGADEDCWERAGRDAMWLRWEILPWGRREGQPEGVLIFAEDITARKRMEATLRESEATTRALLETAAQSILAVDSDGFVVLANRMAVKMFGHAQSKLLGMPIEKLIPERFRTRYFSYRAGFAANPRTGPMGVGMDLRGLRKNGSEFPVEVSLSTVQTSRGTLAVAFVTDISKRKLAETLLRNSENELRALARSLITAQEDERRRVARDLHDDVTQRLALLSIEIGKLAAGTSLSVEEITARLRSFQSQARHASDEIRRLSHGLHPSVIEDFGLSTALEEFCEEFAAAQGIALKFEGLAADGGLSADNASCLYRIAQECLRNVAKHARATEVRVGLTNDGVNVRLVVKDDGAGFSVGLDRANSGLGLISMKERIRMVNGTLSITSQPGQGTAIIASVPLSGGLA
jgi:PAS domain S-box-containing protein